MLQNTQSLENSGQKSCFLRATSSIFHEEINSEILLVPKSRFYRFWITFGTPNDLLLGILGPGWLGQGNLGDRRGAQIEPKLEI